MVAYIYLNGHMYFLIKVPFRGENKHVQPHTDSHFLGSLIVVGKKNFMYSNFFMMMLFFEPPEYWILALRFYGAYENSKTTCL